MNEREQKEQTHHAESLMNAINAVQRLHLAVGGIAAIVVAQLTDDETLAVAKIREVHKELEEAATSLSAAIDAAVAVRGLEEAVDAAGLIRPGRWRSGAPADFPEPA